MTQICRLTASRSHRREQGLFLGDGVKLLEEALKWHAPLDTVMLTEGVDIPDLPDGVRLVQVPRDVMASISPMDSPQGALFLCRTGETAPPERLPGERYLDQLRPQAKAAGILLAVVMVTGLGIYSTYWLTSLDTQRSELRAEEALLAQVMPGAEISTETPYRAPNALSITAGYRENELLGYCVEVQTHGFSGPITMVVGVDLNGQVTGVAVTDHSESTGMGTMAMENAQLRKYVGMSGTIRTSGANSVDVVSGATATSEAITAGVNQALAIVANLETDSSVQYVDSDV